MGWRNRLGIGLALLAVSAISASAQSSRRVAASTSLPRVTAEKIQAGMTYGVKTAPIRIDEYSDFECPHCQHLYLDTLRPMIDQYVANGQVYLVHHDFPLPMHPYARQAAYYADAAAVIGKFEQVEQAIFLHQNEWAANGKVEPFVAAVLTPEQNRQVVALSKTSVVQNNVQNSVRQGMALGIDETPTMYITYKGRHTPIVGAVSYAILRRYIEALLHQ